MRRILFFLLLFLIAASGNTQTVNWANVNPPTRHQLYISAGLNYGLTFGIGYSYQLRTKMPIILNAEYSFPSGKVLTDDFKALIGGQIGLLQVDHFHLNAHLHGVFRRYQNDFARILNFGSDMGLTAGYYRNKWFLAAEAGFDKAIVSNFTHSPAYRDIYPSVEDGWYQPATGGNFYYGLQSGYSFQKSDITLKAGKVISQDFKTEPFLPFYLQLGLNRRF